MRRERRARDSRGMTRRRVLVTSALLASLGPLVGNGLWPGPGADGGPVLADAREGLTGIDYIGVAVELIGFVGLVVLFAWLVVRLLDAAPVAALTTGIAGTAMIAVKVGSAGPIMVVYSMPDKLDAVTAEMLISMNDQAFVISGFLMCLAFLAAGAGLLLTDFPRWLSWWAAVAGGLGTVAGIVGIVRPDLFVPIPFLLCLVWMIAVAITAVMRPDAAPTAVEKRALAPAVGPE